MVRRVASLLLAALMLLLPALAGCSAPADPPDRRLTVNVYDGQGACPACQAADSRDGN